MPRRIDVVINARARRLQDGSGLRRILGRLEGAGTTYVTKSGKDLEIAAKAMVADPPEVLVVAGGDGTAMATVSELVRCFKKKHLPRIALFPGGTVCTVARNWGMGPSRAGYGKSLVEALRSGGVRTLPRATLTVTEPSRLVRTGFILATGFVSNFFEAYYEDGKADLASAARLAMKLSMGAAFGTSFATKLLAPVPMSLTIDGEATPHRSFSVLVASVVKDVGLGVKLTYRGGERTDRFHVVGTAASSRGLASEVTNVMRGRPLDDAGRVDVLAEEAIVRFGRDDRFVLDGELLAAKEIRVTPGPVLDVVHLGTG
ncbi:MAG: diacylglycerol kinase family protein [Polyangiaceae bacterium]